MTGHPDRAPRIAVLATLDTKAAEARYIIERVRGFGGHPVTVNIGTNDVADPLADITQADLQRCADPRAFTADSDKLRTMQRTISGAESRLSALVHAGDVDAAVAIGGGQGSFIAAAVLRALPVGFPRVLVSTAGRDVGQYTQFSDLFSVFSITDVAGTNPLLRRVLDNAAAAVVGMAASTSWREPLPAGLIAISVYGITSAGAAVVLRRLEELGMEPVTFHANGVGGPTMEAQIAGGSFRGVLDLSITEIADEVVGGVCSAGPSRLTTASRLGLPQVVVPGGLDVVNFGAPATVPARFTGRRTYAHTPDATLLRTNTDETVAIARLVGERLNTATAPVRVLIPRRGFSALSAPGAALHDPDADAAFEQSLRATLTNQHVTVDAFDAAVNDPAFALVAADAFAELLSMTPTPS